MSAIDTTIKEAFQTFGKFIYRDMLYVIGGVTVLLAIQYSFDGPTISSNTPTLIYIGFVAYVIGYALQELLSIVGLVTTGYRKLKPYQLRIAEKFAPDEDWGDLLDPRCIRLGKLRQCVDAHGPEDTKKRIERTINLKHLGASGASFIVAAPILLFGAYRHEWNPWALALGISALLLALILGLMSHIKSAQQRLMELAINRECTDCNGSAVITDNTKA